MPGTWNHGPPPGARRGRGACWWIPPRNSIVLQGGFNFTLLFKSQIYFNLQIALPVIFIARFISCQEVNMIHCRRDT